jgi:hypothetical protein
MHDFGFLILDVGYWHLSRIKTKKVQIINKLHLKDNADISATWGMCSCYKQT